MGLLGEDVLWLPASLGLIAGPEAEGLMQPAQGPLALLGGMKVNLLWRGRSRSLIRKMSWGKWLQEHQQGFPGYLCTRECSGWAFTIKKIIINSAECSKAKTRKNPRCRNQHLQENHAASCRQGGFVWYFADPELLTVIFSFSFQTCLLQGKMIEDCWDS